MVALSRDKFICYNASSMVQIQKARVNIFIDPTLAEKAREEAKNSGVRLSFVIEKALEKLFQAVEVGRKVSVEEMEEKMDKVVAEFLEWKKDRNK